jgi:hypothetical protein
MRKPENRIKASRLVGYLIPITDLLESKAKMQICSFHADSRPSAKIYTEDEDGIERLYCYSCRRSFTSFHLLKERGKDPIRVLYDSFPESVIDATWNNMEEDVVLHDSSEHYHLLEGCEPMVDRLERFLRKIYRVEG